MATIYSGNNDGYVLAFSSSSWVNLKNLTTGTASSASLTYYIFAAQSSKLPTRGGGSIWVNARSFFEFDTSSITETPTAATLNIRGITNTAADFFVIASNQGGTLGTGDYDAMVLSGIPSGPDGSGAGSIESYVTKYSDEVTTWTTGFNSIALNSTALSQIASASTFRVMCMESVHDMRDIEPSTHNRTGMYYADFSGTSNDPYLNITEATTATDNATFFGCNF
mgnify:CR=1 FL=1|tara:strand:- start:593 stop:1264 length:672 start_codon:yes stop_codon:yes gene_type:complete